VDKAIVASNPEVRWTDCLHNGYLRLALTPGDARADFLAVDSVIKKNYEVKSLRSERLRRLQGTLVYA
jgi:alkaline phosphatase D